MIYEDSSTRIRPFAKEDATERYRSWFNDPETTRHNSHGLFPYTPEQARAFVAALEGDHSRIIWAVEIIHPSWKMREGWENDPPAMKPSILPPWPKDKWLHVGNVSLQSINLLNRSAELAVVIGDAQARGKGIGRQACQWAVDHAFRRLGLNRVWTGTAATNTGMQKVCDRLGMAVEGRFKHGMFLDGQFVDVIAYGLTADEYFACQ